jgi:hypothetical protein
MLEGETVLQCCTPKKQLCNTFASSARFRCRFPCYSLCCIVAKFRYNSIKEEQMFYHPAILHVVAT